MYSFFKKKPSQLDNSRNQVQQYYSIKEKVQLHLKFKLFLQMLENHAEGGDQKKKIPKQIVDLYKPFCRSFIKLSFQDKYYFMLAMVKIVQTLLDEKKKQQAQPILQYECKIDKIQTTCQVKQSFVGVSHWEDKVFKFMNVQKQVKIFNQTTKKQVIFQLNQYHVRTSTKEKNTIVLQSIFEIWKIPQKHHSYYIYFKDKHVFLEIYNNLKNAVIMTWKARLIGMLNETQSQNIELANDSNGATGVRMLSSKTISDYFKTKQKISHKVTGKQIKFKLFSEIRKVKIYRASKYQNLYKTQNILDHSYEDVLKNIELINRVPFKKLLHYQKMENFSNTISAVYYKYMVKGCTHQMMSIVQEYSKQNEFKVTFKAIDSFVVQKNVDFIEIKVQRIGAGKTRVSVYGFVNFDENKKLNPISVNDFLLSIVQYQSLEQNILVRSAVKDESTFQGESAKIHEECSDQSEIQNQDEDDFHTVVGDNFDSDQDRELQICNTFQSPKKNQNQIQDLGEIQTEQQRNIINEFKNQPGMTHRNVFPDKKQVTFVSNEVKYLKTKYDMFPKQSSKGQKLIKKHYFQGQWGKYQKGGVYSLNQKALDKQKQIFRSILTRLGNALMKKQISNLSIPVIVLRPESQLQSIARNFCFAPLLLENVIDKSPLQKMKTCVILMISMGNLGLSFAKPFNPIIGQTFQGNIDNCPIYLEQTQHHPSISTVLFKGRGYNAYGSVIPSISIGLNTVKGFSLSPLTFQFQNGDKIRFAPNKMQIGGMLVGDRTFDFIDTTYIYDEKNKYVAQITFGPKKKFGKQMKGDKNDFLWGYIYQVSQGFMSKFLKEGRNFSPSIEKSSKITAQVYGCWQQKIYIDQNVVFDFEKDLPYQLCCQAVTLPSNGTFRQDIIFLAEENYSDAQDEKDRLEQIQRKDARLRKNHR